MSLLYQPEVHNSADTMMPEMHRWIFERIKPFLSGNVLEVGSDRGDLAAICFQNGISMYLNAEEPCNQALLENRFSNESCVKGFISLAWHTTDFHAKYSHLFETFDAIIALNADHEAAGNYSRLLRKGGYLFVLTPAHTALYKGLDLGLKYWYNYNMRLIKRMLLLDLDIVKVRYFTIATEAVASDRSTRYNRHVPLFYSPGGAEQKTLGLSILVIGRKKGNSKESSFDNF